MYKAVATWLILAIAYTKCLLVSNSYIGTDRPLDDHWMRVERHYEHNYYHGLKAIDSPIREMPP